MSKIEKTKLQAFLSKEFPQKNFLIECFEKDTVTIRRRVSRADLRPGGTVSGPTMMDLADCALYVAILREIGLIASWPSTP